MPLPGAPPLSRLLHCPLPPRMPVHLIYLPTGHPLLPPRLARFASSHRPLRRPGPRRLPACAIDVLRSSSRLAARCVAKVSSVLSPVCRIRKSAGLTPAPAPRCTVLWPRRVVLTASVGELRFWTWSGVDGAVEAWDGGRRGFQLRCTSASVGLVIVNVREKRCTAWRLELCGVESGGRAGDGGCSPARGLAAQVGGESWE
ncbi:hypothetical protein B0H10DRAFT_2072995 [Mycena sp. CBHHK59/15]|nr:hypothetical protein B0H10DRAFT_2072995 [Mycena sp. CBHHK59/15]